MTETRSAIISLADALRERTARLHARAERAGIVADLLRGRADRHGYALLLRNLLPAYAALEAGLRRHAASSFLGALADPRVYRTRALRADLVALAGEGWRARLPLLDAGARYGREVAGATLGDGRRLAAHAYTRYLGDLAGGRILARLLRRDLGLESDALHFYDFPGVADLDALRARYRAAIDAAGLGLASFEPVVEEGRRAFVLNIELAEAVAAHLPFSPASAREAGDQPGGSGSSGVPPACESR